MTETVVLIVISKSQFISLLKTIEAFHLNIEKSGVPEKCISELTVENHISLELQRVIFRFLSLAYLAMTNGFELTNGLEVNTQPVFDNGTCGVPVSPKDSSNSPTSLLLNSSREIA